MKLRSDKLTRADLHAACPDGTYLYQCDEKGSRLTRAGFTVVLASSDNTRKLCNSGGYGAMQGVRSVTWDEYGIWIDRLFVIDPNVIIGPYHGRDEFREVTCDFINRMTAYNPRYFLKSGELSQYGREHTAPWLESEEN